MTNTKYWILDQIKEYESMLLGLGNNENERGIYAIWNERVNTLRSIYIIMDLEMRLK